MRGLAEQAPLTMRDVADTYAPRRPGWCCGVKMYRVALLDAHCIVERCGECGRRVERTHARHMGDEDV